MGRVDDFDEETERNEALRIEHQFAQRVAREPTLSLILLSQAKNTFETLKTYLTTQ